MKILVLGANGAVGRLVVDELLKAQHEVTALVRPSSAMGMEHPLLTVVHGEATNAADIDKVLAGQEVVISTIGARENKKNTLRADVAKNLVASMKRHSAHRLIWLDGAGVGSSLKFMQRASFLFGRVIIPFFVNHMYDDAAVADAIIEKSDLDWVIVRPVMFTNGPKTGNVSVITDMNLTVPLRLKIARADIAAFMVEQVTQRDHVRQMPLIYN